MASWRGPRPPRREPHCTLSQSPSGFRIKFHKFLTEHIDVSVLRFILRLWLQSIVRSAGRTLLWWAGFTSAWEVVMPLSEGRLLREAIELARMSQLVETVGGEAIEVVFLAKRHAEVLVRAAEALLLVTAVTKRKSAG